MFIISNNMSFGPFDHFDANRYHISISIPIWCRFQCMAPSNRMPAVGRVLQIILDPTVWLISNYWHTIGHTITDNRASFSNHQPDAWHPTTQPTWRRGVSLWRPVAPSRLPSNRPHPVTCYQCIFTARGCKWHNGAVEFLLQCLERERVSGWSTDIN